MDIVEMLMVVDGEEQVARHHGGEEVVKNKQGRCPRRDTENEGKRRTPGREEARRE